MSGQRCSGNFRQPKLAHHRPRRSPDSPDADSRASQWRKIEPACLSALLPYARCWAIKRNTCLGCGVWCANYTAPVIPTWPDRKKAVRDDQYGYRRRHLFENAFGASRIIGASIPVTTNGRRFSASGVISYVILFGPSKATTWSTRR